VLWLNHDKERLHEPISIHREQEGITVDVALQWYILPFPQVAIVLFYMNFFILIFGGKRRVDHHLELILECGVLEQVF
jgi:DNA gyrase/topoisomerase IV subunit B